jgi:hypothetical protein
MINGIIYDYESIQAHLPSGVTRTLEKINYKDKKDDEAITGTNGLPLGIGRGAYSGTCDAEIGRAEYDELDAYAEQQYGGFFNMPPIPLVVSYGHEGQQKTTDKLEVHFTERDFGGSKGDTHLKVSLKGFLTKPLETNGRPAYVAGIN